MLNHKRWDITKAFVWKRANGCCEMCMKEGIVTGSMTKQLDCHHIVPVESGRTVQEMERLCYDVNNIMLVCQDCHIKIHTEAKSHTKEKVAENKARARARFLEANDPNYKEEDNGTERNQETMCVPSPSDGQGGAARPDDTPTD